MDYTKTQQPAFAVVGIGETVSNMDPAAGPKIEALWQRFFAEGIAAQVPDALDGAFVALYTDYQGDYTKPYLYMVGVRAPSGTQPPDGLIAREVPAQTMAKIEAKGPLPQSVIEAWQSVWQSDLNRSYIADFDIYAGEGEPVSIFVGID